MGFIMITAIFLAIVVPLYPLLIAIQRYDLYKYDLALARAKYLDLGNKLPDQSYEKRLKRWKYRQKQIMIKRLEEKFNEKKARLGAHS